MLDALYEEIDRVVPADQGVAVNELVGGVPYCTRWPEYCTPLIPRFNSHFNTCCPPIYDPERHLLGAVNWHRHSSTEYDTDFNRPLGIGHSLGVGIHDPLHGREVVYVVHRSRRDPGFTEEDETALLALRPLLSKILTLAREAELLRKEHFSPEELAPEAAPLSRREAEVAQLLSRRLTMREIARRLSISPRTVERHALHIYRKLNVAGRHELVRCLGSSPWRKGEDE
jgi:DNA-binding CsgD family transcriptional regulator